MRDLRASTIILDFDNTLYDWVAQWYESFSAMLKEIQRLSGISEENLKQEIRKIHQQHHTSEYAFLRNIFSTIVVALIAGVGYSIKEKIAISFGISFAPILCVAAIFITALFYFVDRYWYHRLLMGSVIEAMRLEEEISKISDVEIRLSRQIKDESPVSLPPLVEWFASFFINEKKFRETKKLHSDGKIEFFYKSIMIMFAGLAILTLCVKTS